MKQEGKSTEEIADDSIIKDGKLLMEGKRGGFKKMNVGLSHSNA